MDRATRGDPAQWPRPARMCRIGQELPSVSKQLFGPVRLHVNAERVLVVGYEMSAKDVRWREVGLSTIVGGG